jgi:hypothetical protein
LHSKYLYDSIGSALFEVITMLPEYGLTRADERLLRANAGEIVGKVPSPAIVAELGSGSGRKTRWILEALLSGVTSSTIRSMFRARSACLPQRARNVGLGSHRGYRGHYHGWIARSDLRGEARRTA